MTLENRHLRKPRSPKPPLVSWTVQSSLRDDIADPAAHKTFVTTSTQMWPGRYCRLAEAIARQDLG